MNFSFILFYYVSFDSLASLFSPGELAFLMLDTMLVPLPELMDRLDHRLCGDLKLYHPGQHRPNRFLLLDQQALPKMPSFSLSIYFMC